MPELSLIQSFPFEVKAGGSPFSVTIPDSEDVDMTFYLHLKHVDDENDAKTSFTSPDNKTGEFLVTMTRNGRASLDRPMAIGTYQKKYKLLMNFDIEPEGGDGMHRGLLSFYIKAK